MPRVIFHPDKLVVNHLLSSLVDKSITTEFGGPRNRSLENVSARPLDAASGVVKWPRAASHTCRHCGLGQMNPRGKKPSKSLSLKKSAESEDPALGKCSGLWVWERFKRRAFGDEGTAPVIIARTVALALCDNLWTPVQNYWREQNKRLRHS